MHRRPLLRSARPVIFGASLPAWPQRARAIPHIGQDARSPGSNVIGLRCSHGERPPSASNAEGEIVPAVPRCGSRESKFDLVLDQKAAPLLGHPCWCARIRWFG